MKRMLLEFTMVLTLIILSGIVLADDFFHQSDDTFSTIRDQQRTMESETRYARRLDLKNRMKDMDGINQTYYERNRLVESHQYFYAKGRAEQYKTIKM